jgi:hypothetical protein
MAHYAFLDENNVVTEVIVGREETEGVDWESVYAEVRGQRCLRTSYNTLAGKRPDGSPGYRGNYAGISYTYDERLDAFISPCPGDGWTLDEAAATWVETSQ